MSRRKTTKSHLPIPLNFAETPIAPAAWLKTNSVTNSIGMPARKPGRRFSTNSGLIHVAPRSTTSDHSLRPKTKSRLAKGLRLVANALCATGASCATGATGGGRRSNRRGRLAKETSQHADEDSDEPKHHHAEEQRCEVQFVPAAHDSLFRAAREIDHFHGVTDVQSGQWPRRRAPDRVRRSRPVVVRDHRE